MSENASSNRTMKANRLGLRISESLKRRVEAASGQVGVPTAVVVRACLQAFCDHVDKGKGVTFPIVIFPEEIRRKTEV